MQGTAAQGHAEAHAGESQIWHDVAAPAGSQAWREESGGAAQALPLQAAAAERCGVSDEAAGQSPGEGTYPAIGHGYGNEDEGASLAPGGDQGLLRVMPRAPRVGLRRTTWARALTLDPSAVQAGWAAARLLWPPTTMTRTPPLVRQEGFYLNLNLKLLRVTIPVPDQLPRSASMSPRMVKVMRTRPRALDDLTCCAFSSYQRSRCA